jgi:ketosteroid isomerase-like protein
MSNDVDYRGEIVAALDKYKIAYSKKDANMLLAITDEGFFGFGSGPDEKVGDIDELEKQLHRDFAQCEDLDIDFGPMAVAGDGNVAWCAGDCIISATVGGEWMRLQGRMTTVLRKAGGKWLFAHTHFSVPDRGQSEGQSAPARLVAAN